MRVRMIEVVTVKVQDQCSRSKVLLPANGSGSGG